MGYEDGDVLVAGATGYQVKTYKMKYDRETDALLSKDYITTTHYKKIDRVEVKIEDPEESTEETVPETTEGTTPPESETTEPDQTTTPPTETTTPPTETTAPPTETTVPPTETTAPPAETTGRGVSPVSARLACNWSVIFRRDWPMEVRV